MEWISKTDAMGILVFVLPGFLAASIFYSLTAHPKKDAFERVVQALVFTLFIKAMDIGVRAIWWVTWHRKHPGAYWTDNIGYVWSVANAVLLGFFLAFALNWDAAHCVLRKLRITKRTSYPSEWYSGFHRFRRELILHLTGERRLKGWADEWPDQCDCGHFLIQEPQWLDEAGKITAFSQVKRLLIRAEDVEMVEFLFNPEELTKSRDVIVSEQKELADSHQKRKESEDGREKPTPAATDTGKVLEHGNVVEKPADKR